jgi:hypothetical protein
MQEYYSNINVGDVNGNWQVIDNKIIRKRNSRYISCKCKCGTVKELLVQNFIRTDAFNSCADCAVRGPRNLPTRHRTIKNGDVFGNWTVIDNTVVRDYEVYSNGNKSKYKQPKILVKCVCGNTQMVKPTYVTNNKKESCKACFKPPRGNNHYKWGGVDSIPGTVLYGIKSRVRRAATEGKIIDLNITTEYLAKIYQEQGGRCALTGVPIEASITNTKSRGRVWTASVDRIDSSKGYIEGNIQWLHKDINRMKWDLDTQEFIKLCKLVADKHG